MRAWTTGDERCSNSPQSMSVHQRQDLGSEGPTGPLEAAEGRLPTANGPPRPRARPVSDEGVSRAELQTAPPRTC